jgi:hypothetical protein
VASELHLLSYLVQNPGRYRLCRGYLEELAIESPALHVTWNLLQSKFKEYDNFPSLEEAKWLVEQKAPGQAQDIQAIMDLVYTTPVGGVSGEYLTELLVNTEKVKLFDRLEKSRSLQDLQELQDRIRILQECLVMDTPKWFSPFAEKLISNPFKTLESHWGTPIPFGLPEMDVWMQGGGRRGELITLIGLTGGGKSILLLWWALWQAMQGYYVVYFSYDNVVGELLSRLWCASSGVLMDQVEATPEAEFAARLIGFAKQFSGIERRFIIEKYPRGTRTVRDIESTIDQVEQWLGRTLDAVYVDYGDCVKAQDIKKDVRFQLDSVFSSLGALAEEYNIMLVTATQANRAAKYLEVLDIDSAAEAWQKIWHSAVAMALCQSRLEKMMGKARLVVGKARRTRTDYIVPILLDPNNMRVLQDPTAKIQYRAALEQIEAEASRMDRQKGKAPAAPKPDALLMGALTGMQFGDHLGEVRNQQPQWPGIIPVGSGAMPGTTW